MHRLVIASVTLLGLVGAAVVAGYVFLFAAGSDRAAALAPAETAVYVNVYLEPSSAQQTNLARLIGRLPGFADEAALDEKVDQIVQNLLSGTGIDYRADVKPWLGNQIAIAAWPTGTDASDSQTLVIAEVRDPAAAEDGVARLAAQGGPLDTETYEGVELHVGETTSYAFLDDLVVIGPGAEALQAAVDARGGTSLADDPDFRAAMERVPADHLASVFVDVAGVAGASGAETDASGLSTASAALVAEPEGLRLSGSAPLDPAARPSAAADAPGGTPTLTAWMPEGTLAEVTLFGVRQLLEEAEAAVAVPQAEDLGSALDALRAIAAFGLGIDLDADVLPLLDGEVAVAVAGLDGAALPSGQLLLRPTDADAVEATVANLRDRLAAAGATVSTEMVEGVEITTLELPDTGSASYAVTDGVVIIGPSAADVGAAIEAGATGANLASSDAYGRAFTTAGTHEGGEAYVDVAALSEALGEALTLSQDARDILSGIGTFALTLPSRNDQIEFHAVLTVDEP